MVQKSFGRFDLISYVSGYARRWKYIQNHHRIEWFALVLGGDVEMLACTATRGASDTYWEADED